MQNLQDQLKKTVSGRVCVVGVGNRLRGDDGAGPLLIDLLQGRLAAACIDAGSAPENHLERIVQAAPDTVLIVDAVDFRGKAGEIRILDPARIGAGALSTHALSLEMLRQYLDQRIAPRIHLLAIQPATLALGAPVSADVQTAVESLAETLTRLWPRA